MLNNILNLDGVSVLDKKQQKLINGGLMQEQGQCKFLFTGSDGETARQTITFADPPSESDSSYANNYCLGAINNYGWASCRYDCNYDGWGN